MAVHFYTKKCIRKIGTTGSFKRVKFSSDTKTLICAMKDKVPQKKTVAENKFYFSVLLFNLRKK